MKIAATASYNAVPSMLIVAPMGRTNLQTLGSTLFLLSSKPMVTGRVALLDPVPNAVVHAFAMLAINLNGRDFVVKVKMVGRTMKPCMNSPTIQT